MTTSTPSRRLACARHQHFEGLADTGRRAEKDFEATPPLMLGLNQQRVRRGSVGAIGSVVVHIAGLIESVAFI